MAPISPTSDRNNLKAEKSSYAANGNRAFLQDEERIIPIEVKAEENLQAKSLRVFVERNQGLKGMRLSMSPYREQDWLANYPLYSASPNCEPCRHASFIVGTLLLFE